MSRKTKYDPAYCERAVEILREGASIGEVAAELGVVRRTIYSWRDANPEFAEALNHGVELSEVWWERQARMNLLNKSFNYPTWYANMKNRFGWRDRQEVEHSGGVNINVVKFSDVVNDANRSDSE